MLSTNRQVNINNQFYYGQECLPQMTALFVDSLTGLKSKGGRPKLDSNPVDWCQSDILRFKIPVLTKDRMTTDEVKNFCARIEKPNCKNRHEKSDAGIDTLRDFICGISNAFNNILMGVWGNISLLTMTLDHSSPVINQIRHMDRLIQNGSLLIHSLFGYLAERRVATRHLRLVQLVQEINERIQGPDIAIDIKEIEKSLETALLNTRPTMVARGMTYVLDQLLHWIDSELQSALLEAPKEQDIIKRLHTIDTVLKRGFNLVRQLQLYAGDQKPVWRNINVESLIRQQAKQSRKCFDHVRFSVEVSDALRPLKADRSLLKFVLEQLILNAVAAVSEGGKVKISARPINEEAPMERCVVHQGCNYYVITVSDNGRGMNTRTQSKIFLPFFVGNRKSNPIGLGLAASSSIAKLHGGYIQVKSKKGQGSVFKLYLPEGNRESAFRAL